MCVILADGTTELGEYRRGARTVTIPSAKPLLAEPERMASLGSIVNSAVNGSSIDAIDCSPPDLHRCFEGHDDAGCRAGGPGNHDPERAHPEVPAILRARCGLSPDDRRMDIYLGPGPGRATVGNLEVVIGHGHRGDSWNDIDPAMVLYHATTNPPLPMELPLGSRLVVGAMRALPGVAKLGARAWVGGLQRRLRRGPTLPAWESELVSPLQPPNDIDLLAGALFDALIPDERTDSTIAAIDDWLAGHGPRSTGTLASHSGGRYLLRAALRLLGRNGTAFDQTRLDGADEAIIKEHLPRGCGPRVVIAGHTHAARYVRLDADRMYINTGTWSDLIPWPPLRSDEDAMSFIDELDANEVPVLRRLTWALVDEQGARLL